MLLAENDPMAAWGWIALGGTAVVSILTAVTTTVIAILNARHRNKQEREKSTVTQWQHIADRQDRQIEELLKESTRCRAAEQACQSDLSEQRELHRQLYDSHADLHAAAIKAGLIIGPLPATPPAAPPRSLVAEAAFVARRQEHEAALLRREKDEAKTPPTGEAGRDSSAGRRQPGQP